MKYGFPYYTVTSKSFYPPPDTWERFVTLDNKLSPIGGKFLPKFIEASKHYGIIEDH